MLAKVDQRGEGRGRRRDLLFSKDTCPEMFETKISLGLSGRLGQT